MSHYQHPDEVGGGAFLLLFIAAIAYFWFLYDSVGNFKTCNPEKYPYALICVPPEKS